MIYTLEGEQLNIAVETKGAELKSIKDNKNNHEYMWSGDSKYWGKTSPILFPFVGALKNGEYTYAGNTYQISRHGFARDMEFQLVEKREDSLVFSLEDTEETRENYPFKFCLEIEYQLEGKSLEVKWRVINKDTKTMYFSIGGHPAFACPMVSGLNRTDCYIKLSDVNHIKTTYLDMASGLITGEYVTYKCEEGFLPISENLFDNDALIVENSQCNEVSICDKDKKPYLTVTFDAPLFGLWSVPDINASYVCIEPWYGRCDSMNFEGELQDRDWTNCLKPGEVFAKKYEIEIKE